MLAEGLSLTKACKQLGMSHGTVLDWVTGYRGSNADPLEMGRFRDSYYRARRAQAEFMADELIEIADQPMVSEITRTKVTERGVETVTEVGDNVDRSKLRSANRIYLMGAFEPQRYGPRQQLDFNTNLTVMIVEQLSDARDRAARLRMQANLQAVDTLSSDSSTIDVTPATSNDLQLEQPSNPGDPKP